LDVCNLTKNIAAVCVLSLSKPESPRCSNCLQFRLSDNHVLRKFYTEFKSLTGLFHFDFFAIRMISRSAIPRVEKLLFRLTHVFVLYLLRTQRSFAGLDRAELPHDDLSWLAAVKQRKIDQFSNMEMKLPKWLLWRWKLSIRPFVTVRL